MEAEIKTYTLPDGVEARFQPVEIRGGEGMIVELMAGGSVLARYCSCNGVKISCPAGTSPSCDCTKNPPVLTCVKTTAAAPEAAALKY